MDCRCHQRRNDRNGDDGWIDHHSRWWRWFPDGYCFPATATFCWKLGRPPATLTATRLSAVREETSLSSRLMTLLALQRLNQRERNNFYRRPGRQPAHRKPAFAKHTWRPIRCGDILLLSASTLTIDATLQSSHGNIGAFSGSDILQTRMLSHPTAMYYSMHPAILR